MDDKKRGSQKTNDDSGLFRRLMSDAKPLRHSAKAPPHRPGVAPRARFARSDEQAALRESLEGDIDETEAGGGEHLRFHRASIGRRTMRRLARGYYSVQAEIDLHGMTVPEARGALHDFLNECHLRGHSCVRVVHGKGLGSGDRGPVLKRSVNRWLRRWNAVLAFVSARQIDGGTGAVYVLLQKP